MAHTPLYIVFTERGAFGCDTAREVASLRVKNPEAPVRQVRPNPRSAEYRHGAEQVRLALAERQANPAAALSMLEPHQTYRINGHRVRVLSDRDVVVDGVRMSHASANRRLARK